MFWADRIVDQILNTPRFKGKIEAREPLVIRDEKTASGRVHVGSLRGVAIHGIISHILNERGVANQFLYEINDFDPMDGLPVYLDQARFEPHMGKPLNTIPAPEASGLNFAEYYGQEFEKVITDTGFHPMFYRASELYRSGRMNDVIRLALEGASEIRRIYEEISGSKRREDWFPLSVVCEHCGKVSMTRVSVWDGEKVTYVCKEDAVPWGRGCGHASSVSPFDGRAKLPWKVEWPAKWKVVGVDIEGAGKDHSTKGGARDVANHISREVFGYQPPFDIPYEFFLVGGAKMSSSKGKGAYAREMADLLPPTILRLVLFGKQPMQAINVEPEGDTMPTLFDRYDRLAEKYWGKIEDDDSRLFALVHAGNPPAKHFLPRFSQVVFLAQMPHIDGEAEIARLKGSALTDLDQAEFALRSEYARRWLALYAPEEYKYELQTQSVPPGALHFRPEQKVALKRVLEYVHAHEFLDGQEFHTALHEIRKETGLDPKAFFGPLYLSFLGKDYGPKAGWFFSVLDKQFVEKRLAEIVGVE